MKENCVLELKGREVEAILFYLRDEVARFSFQARREDEESDVAVYCNECIREIAELIERIRVQM